jgi:hypothetical protein
MTVHFKRMTYLVEPGPDTSALGGKRVRVYEWEDGRVEIHAEGRALPYSIFDQNPNVTQGAIVENKRLGAALAIIQTAQSERDRIRLDSKKLTIRQKDLIRAAREASPPSEPMAKNCDRLGAVAAYFQQFEKEQDERRQALNLKELSAAKSALSPCQTGHLYLAQKRTFLLSLDIFSAKGKWFLKGLSTGKGKMVLEGTIHTADHPARLAREVAPPPAGVA